MGNILFGFTEPTVKPELCITPQVSSLESSIQTQSWLGVGGAKKELYIAPQISSLESSLHTQSLIGVGGDGHISGENHS